MKCSRIVFEGYVEVRSQTSRSRITPVLCERRKAEHFYVEIHRTSDSSASLTYLESSHCVQLVTTKRTVYHIISRSYVGHVVRIPVWLSVGVSSVHFTQACLGICAQILPSRILSFSGQAFSFHWAWLVFLSCGSGEAPTTNSVSPVSTVVS